MMKHKIIQLVLAFMLLMAWQNAAAQYKFTCQQLDGKTGGEFMKEHPEYIYVNKPEDGGGWYYISEYFSPRILGLNNNNFYVIFESFDVNGKPKALLWDGVFKQRISKRITDSKRRVVFFVNTCHAGDLLPIDSEHKVHWKIRWGISANGVSYPRQRYTTSSWDVMELVFGNPHVEVYPTKQPDKWLATRLKESKNLHARPFQQPASLVDGTGWFFDVSFTDVRGYTKYHLSHRLELSLWKDADCKEPLLFAKMPQSQLAYDSNFDRDEADCENFIDFDNSYDPLMHQYYFLPVSAITNADQCEMLNDGSMRLTAYYKVKLDLMPESEKCPIYCGQSEEGKLSVVVLPNGVPGRAYTEGEELVIGPVSSLEEIKACPPHNYQVVDNRKKLHVTSSTSVSTVQRPLPEKYTLRIGKTEVTLLLQERGGCHYYMSETPIYGSLWKYIMGYDNYSYPHSNTPPYRIYEFFAKLNAQARLENKPFTFMLPNFDDLKTFQQKHELETEALVDSMEIRAVDGKNLTPEEVELMKDKGGIRILAGYVKTNGVLGLEALDDSTLNNYIYLKAYHDREPVPTMQTSVTRSHLLTAIMRECSRCGKRITSYNHSRHIDVKRLFLPEDERDDGLDLLEFAHSLVTLDNYEQACQRSNEASFPGNALKKKSFKGMRTRGDKEELSIYRSSKKTSSITSVHLSLKGGSESEVCRDIESHGYKLIRTEQKTGTTGTLMTDHYYQHPDGKHYICYVTFSVGNFSPSHLLMFQKDKFN